MNNAANIEVKDIHYGQPDAENRPPVSRSEAAMQLDFFCFNPEHLDPLPYYFAILTLSEDGQSIEIVLQERDISTEEGIKSQDEITFKIDLSDIKDILLCAGSTIPAAKALYKKFEALGFQSSVDILPDQQIGNPAIGLVGLLQEYHFDHVVPASANQENASAAPTVS